MATITIRKLDESLKAKLRLAAARRGCSMEEEVRMILREALADGTQGGLGSRIRQRFGAADGAELDLPARTDTPRAPNFGA